MSLELTSLTVRYGTGRNMLTAVDSIDLSVPQGGTMGLVGESGCGKSTVARAVVALTPIAGGQIHLDGKDFSSMKVRKQPEFRRRVQMVFQNPYMSLNPRMTIGDMLVDVLRRAAIVPRAGRDAEARRLLDLVGLPSDTLARYPHQFSGGQRQRVAIARALAVRPEMIIHDEVTSALDMSVQATILNLLKNLQKELNLSYLFISHDLSTVRYMSDNVAVMYLGQIVEMAPTSDLFDRPSHPYTKALMASVPQFGLPRRAAPLMGDPPDPRDPPSGCHFRTRCPVGPVFNPERTICNEISPQTGSQQRLHNVACHFAADEKAAVIAGPQQNGV
jgi:peptide/nickel transport system ATP-binding protein